ncbi:MAG: hypothetical protein HY718_13900 [Planctomycetes bacterium]|nr:hypothetical protein [Planctomycetota bacterium]
MVNRGHKRCFRRRAAAAAMVAISGTVLIGVAALAIDMGMLYNTRTEAQRSADAGALAGAWRLVGEERLLGSTGATTVASAARTTASSTANANKVFNSNPTVDTNTGNASDGDILLGRLDHPGNLTEQIQTSVDPTRYNTVSVLVRRDSTRNGAIPLVFAHVFGLSSKDISARGVASVEDKIVGYKVTGRSGNAELMPFAVNLNAWNALLAGTQTSGDNYRYDPASKTVSAGGDGVNELNIYPGSGSGQLPPGNFGTVDIGNPNNSTADISRQIREGVSASDLAYFGGELKFDDNGEIILEGDTGLSAAVKDDLASIIGKPRAIPLFTVVSGNGNNSRYTVVAFAGIRIMNVKLTGSMSKKSLIVQPAVVVDDAAVSGETSNTSYFVYRPPTLVR